MTDRPAARIDLEVGIRAIQKLGGRGGAPQDILFPHQRESLAGIEQQTARAQRSCHHGSNDGLGVGGGGQPRRPEFLSLGRLPLGPQSAPQRQPSLHHAGMLRHDRRDLRLSGDGIAPSQHLHGELDFAAGLGRDAGQSVGGEAFARTVHQRQQFRIGGLVERPEHLRRHLEVAQDEPVLRELCREPCVAARMRLGGLEQSRGLGEAALPEPDPGQVDQVLGVFRTELDRRLQRLLSFDPELGLDQQDGAKRMQWPVPREDGEGLAAQGAGRLRVLGREPGDALTRSVLAQSPDLRLGVGRGVWNGRGRARRLGGWSRHA